MEQPLHDFGGEGQTLHLAVANGFPPQTYIPFVRPFLDQFHVVNLPPRPLWSNEPPPVRMINWRDLVAVDLLNGMRQHNMNNIIAVGHSFGGVASMVAVMREPERFKALVVIDPPVLPPAKLYWMRLKRLFGKEASDGLESSALRRRTQFESVEAAYENFKRKRIFADWHDEALRAYAETMIPDEQGVRLAWSNLWEAYFFRTWILYTRIWFDIPRLNDLAIPILLIRGETSTTFLPPASDRMRRILPRLHYAEVEGHGHLVPHSAPEQTAQIVLDWLSSVSADEVENQET